MNRIKQAYAELEKDTPGQIHGITYKSDGKSSSTESGENVSEKFTQRAKKEDFYYEESDIKETQDYKEKTKASSYFVFGFVCIVILFFFIQGDNYTKNMIKDERDRVIREQGESNEYPIGQPPRRRRQNGDSPFDEA